MNAAAYIPQGEVKEIELIWDRKLILAISYEDGISPTANSHTDIAAIDMGEIHGIAAVADTGHALIVTSRKLRSIKRLRNKKHAKLRKKQSRCKKGSRRWKKLQRAINQISSKTDRQQQDILHKMSRKFAVWADEQQVKTVVVGDVEGVQRNTSNRKKDNPKQKQRTRRQNQRLSQWPFGLLFTIGGRGSHKETTAVKTVVVLKLQLFHYLPFRFLPAWTVSSAGRSN